MAYLPESTGPESFTVVTACGEAGEAAFASGELRRAKGRGRSLRWPLRPLAFSFASPTGDHVHKNASPEQQPLIQSPLRTLVSSLSEQLPYLVAWGCLRAFPWQLRVVSDSISEFPLAFVGLRIKKPDFALECCQERGLGCRIVFTGSKDIESIARFLRKHSCLTEARTSSDIEVRFTTTSRLIGYPNRTVPNAIDLVELALQLVIATSLSLSVLDSVQEEKMTVPFLQSLASERAIA